MTSAGLNPAALWGVFLQSRSAIYTSVPLAYAFFIVAFASFTGACAWPLDLGWCSEDVSCLTCEALVNLANSLERNCGLHAASSGLVASPNPIAAIPFARASGKGLL